MSDKGRKTFRQDPNNNYDLFCHLKEQLWPRSYLLLRCVPGTCLSRGYTTRFCVSGVCLEVTNASLLSFTLCHCCCYVFRFSRLFCHLLSITATGMSSGFHDSFVIYLRQATANTCTFYFPFLFLFFIFFYLSKSVAVLV